MPTGSIGGYEWGFTCPACEEFLDLSGTHMGSTPIINGEKKYRTRELSDGDTIGCSECGHATTLRFE